MIDELIEKIKVFLNSRMIPLVLLFICMFFVLIQRIFVMQIVQGSEVALSEEYKSTKDLHIKSTRGDIYDRNGVLLAYNELKYAIVISESATLTTNAQKNEMIYRLIKLLEKHGNNLELNFCIYIDEQGKLAFNVKENAELRFKKDAYGLRYVSELSEEQRNATAEEVFQYLKSGAYRFSISDEYSLEDTLKIMTVRYTFLIQVKKYESFTLVSNASSETVAAIKENLANLPGVEVQQQTYRVYNDAEYFAHIIGYTGLINTTELESLNEELAEDEEKYTSSDYVGKKGIEKEMEPYLTGTKGIQQVVVNGSNKILETKVIKEPVKGNDIYLSIDRDLQIACYHILERNIAAVLKSKIVNSMNYGTKGTKAAGITIPIYEVYNALIANNVIDIKQFKAEDATDLERKALGYFEDKRVSILDKLHVLLAPDSQVTNTEAGEEMEEYLDYIYQFMQSASTNNLVIRSKVDWEDAMYKDYAQNNKIGLTPYLKYAINKNWIDLSVLGINGEEFYTTDEIYTLMMDYVFELLMEDTEFEKMIYKNLIFTKKLSGKEICLLLFDQNVLEYSETTYNRLSSGNISSYDFIMEKIENLEITPAQLALEPCSGSIVINDVNTGEVIVMASYPSYDNNKLANKIDWDYYSKLLVDKSNPLQNRPSQELTTTGSTFKPLSSLIGFGENLITTTTRIRDKVKFDLVDPSPSCWKSSSHGTINVTQAIQHSCNYFYYELGYRLSSSGSFYDDAKGINKIQEYAKMFGFGDKTGIEVEESTPVISNRDAVRTMIGYYHNFAPVQIARYISTVANRGTCLAFTLVHEIKENDGSSIYLQETKEHSEITMFSDAEWNAVQKGMHDVVNTSASSLDRLYGNLGVKVAGKTGTAQVSTTKPHHALFTSFAPYDNPQISVTVVIPNGYASANAAKTGREVYGLYYNNENKEALLSGKIKAGNATSITISD